MLMRDRVFIVIVLLALLATAILETASQQERLRITASSRGVELLIRPGKEEGAERANQHIPDFSKYVVIAEKKAAFFHFLLPMVRAINDSVLLDRQRLLAFREKLAVESRLSLFERKRLYDLAKYYRVKSNSLSDPAKVEVLLKRVDVVPASLVLSQSANESAWGTSRFALQGNNLFGQWCFTVGCGIVPGRRPQGASFEVASFSHPRDSVEAYINNLNTNSAYLHFRELRQELRDRGQPLSGELLAAGLLNYSARGEDYIAEVRSMIRVNDLAQYDLI